MHPILRHLALAATAFALAAPAHALITFYEHDGFQGRSFNSERAVSDFNRLGFGDSVSSVVVRDDRWEVCDDVGFRGRCVVLRQGQYPSLSAMGLNDRVSSARILPRDARVDDDRYAPPPRVASDYRRRGRERLYDAQVTSVRAVLGTPEQRCWMEREALPEERRRTNVPGAVIGAVIGGILGHQVGGGSGRDIATVGGVVAGGAIGANVGRNDGRAEGPGRDVQRCEAVPNSGAPDYWDVTYTFRGREHRVQLESEPGRTIRVNRDGEPRA